MKKFKLYWLDGKIEIIKGKDAVDAFNRAGIGRGALPALDYYEEVKEGKQNEEAEMQVLRKI